MASMRGVRMVDDAPRRRVWFDVLVVSFRSGRPCTSKVVGASHEDGLCTSRPANVVSVVRTCDVGSES